MADEIDIEPEFEDEGSFRDRLQKQLNTDQPGDASVSSGEPVIENDITGSPSGIPFPGSNPAANKKREREIREQEARVRKQYRREQQERLAELRREQAEQRRNQDNQRREDMAASREAVRDIRAEAISDRVASYSLAAAIGLPGYVIGSVVDSVFIRPQEEKDIAKQKQYQKDLDNYHKQVKKDREEEAYRRQQEIKNTPMQATVFDDQGNPIPPSPPNTTASNAPPTPPVWTPPTSTAGGNIPPTPPTQPPIPPNPPVQPPNPPNPPNPPVRPPGGGNTPPLPPGQPPTPPGQPPPIRPTPPTTGGSVFGGLGTAIPIITGTIEGAQFINRVVDRAGEQASTFGQNIVRNDATESSKSLIRGAQSIYDPLGINVPLNVAVQGFTALLDINQAILDTTRENLGFAPQSLQADVQSDIAKLLRQIEASQKTDATTAQLIKANQQLEAAWNELRTKLINEYGPTIIATLKLIETSVKTLTLLREVPVAAIQQLVPAWATGILKALITIAGNTEKDQLDNMNNNIFNQLNAFLDPKTPVRTK